MSNSVPKMNESCAVTCPFSCSTRMKTERVTIETYDIKKQFQSEKKSRELKNGHPRVRACVSRRNYVTSMLQHCRQLGEFFFLVSGSPFVSLKPIRNVAMSSRDSRSHLFETQRIKVLAGIECSCTTRKEHKRAKARASSRREKAF